MILREDQRRELSFKNPKSYKSDGKCQQRSNLQNWIAVINTPRTDTHRIYAMHTLIMTFTFADLTAVDICHPT